MLWLLHGAPARLTHTHTYSLSLSLSLSLSHQQILLMKVQW